MLFMTINTPNVQLLMIFVRNFFLVSIVEIYVKNEKKEVQIFGEIFVLETIKTWIAVAVAVVVVVEKTLKLVKMKKLEEKEWLWVWVVFPHFYNNSISLLWFRSQPADHAIAYEEHCGQKKRKKERKAEKSFEQTTVTKINIDGTTTTTIILDNHSCNIHGRIQSIATC